jgi:hypothetical protein
MDELTKLRLTNDALLRENVRLATANTKLRTERFRNFNNDECWVYQGDGEDHLESLVCPVVISAQKLIELGG